MGTLAVDFGRKGKNQPHSLAQRTIKPVEVEQELITSDEILGDEQDVERFVQSACSSLNCGLIKKKQAWLLPTPPEFLKPC